MKRVVRFSEREELRALDVLLRHSPGMVLPGRTYVISEEAARALRDAGISFTDLGTEVNAPNLEEAGTGERV